MGSRTTRAGAKSGGESSKSPRALPKLPKPSAGKPLSEFELLQSYANARASGNVEAATRLLNSYKRLKATQKVSAAEKKALAAIDAFNRAAGPRVI